MCFENEFPPPSPTKNICMLNISKLLSIKVACSPHPPATYEHACFPMPATVRSNSLILVNEWKTLDCPSWLFVIIIPFLQWEASTCPHNLPPWSSMVILHFLLPSLSQDKIFFSELAEHVFLISESHHLISSSKHLASLHPRWGEQAHFVTISWSPVKFLSHFAVLSVPVLLSWNYSCSFVR